MKKIDEELIQEIEKVFGFPLYDWQKAFLKDEIDFISNGRKNGKTFIVCLKILLTNDEKMKKVRFKQIFRWIQNQKKGVRSSSVRSSYA